MRSEIYDAMGGAAGCRRLSTAFYARVKTDRVLRPLFPGKSLRCAIEAFSAFLVQFLGGPSDESQHRWWLSLHESHLRFRIGQKERDAWMSHMIQALEEARIEEPARSALRELFEHGSTYVINAGPRKPAETSIHPAIAGEWSAQRTLDEAVAAVRAGDGDRAIELAEGRGLQAYLKERPTVLAGLLAAMIGGGEAVMVEYVKGKLRDNPAMAQERYWGRTLLHYASGAGSLAVVKLLLELGAGANAADGGGHTPLYSVGNECHVRSGSSVVRVLVEADADVNACDGVKGCTALHMAARRGNVNVAEALLDCGADVEARDSLGETPLRRAVNCNKSQVAALLLSRGADANSIGSKGLTPRSAARSSEMKQILRSGISR